MTRTFQSPRPNFCNHLATIASISEEHPWRAAKTPMWYRRRYVSKQRFPQRTGISITLFRVTFPTIMGSSSLHSANRIAQQSSPALNGFWLKSMKTRFGAERSSCETLRGAFAHRCPTSPTIPSRRERRTGPLPSINIIAPDSLEHSVVNNPAKAPAHPARSKEVYSVGT